MNDDYYIVFSVLYTHDYIIVKTSKSNILIVYATSFFCDWD